MKKILRIAAAAVITTAGLGLAGSGAAGVAEAFPGPFPDYHWCPGQFWDPGWGNNWDGAAATTTSITTASPTTRVTGMAPAPGIPEPVPL